MFFSLIFRLYVVHCWTSWPRMGRKTHFWQNQIHELCRMQEEIWYCQIFCHIWRKSSPLHQKRVDFFKISSSKVERNLNLNFPAHFPLIWVFTLFLGCAALAGSLYRCQLFYYCQICYWPCEQTWVIPFFQVLCTKVFFLKW